MLDAIYVDAKETKSIIAIKPKPPFKPILQIEASREKSDISILNEPLKGSSVFLVESWIVELHLKQCSALQTHLKLFRTTDRSKASMD